tara:strand:- start:496 stop:1098 length:603 start_codon:yes stop_codon:yes gene_type:complete
MADWKAAVDKELDVLRAKQTTLKQAGASRAEIKQIEKRKADLKMLKKKGINPVLTAPSMSKLPSVGASLPSSMPSLPSFPTFTPPTEDEIGEFAGTLGFGTVSGFCSGMALKKIGRAGATVAGVTFMAATAAQQSGYIDVNWKKVEQDVMGTMDQNGDGKVDSTDFNLAKQRFIRYMTEKNSAATAGTFAVGLVMGFRNG